MSKRVGGLISVKVNGSQVKAKGSFTFNLGASKKEPIVGVDGYHGHTELPIPAKLEGTITDDQDLDVKAFAELSDETVTLELANGKVVVFKQAVQTADMDQTTEEGEIPVMFSAPFAEEIS